MSNVIKPLTVYAKALTGMINGQPNPATTYSFCNVTQAMVTAQNTLLIVVEGGNVYEAELSAVIPLFAFDNWQSYYAWCGFGANVGNGAGQ